MFFHLLGGGYVLYEAFFLQGSLASPHERFAAIGVFHGVMGALMMLVLIGGGSKKAHASTAPGSADANTDPKKGN